VLAVLCCPVLAVLKLLAAGCGNLMLSSGCPLGHERKVLLLRTKPASKQEQQFQAVMGNVGYVVYVGYVTVIDICGTRAIKRYACSTPV
jgi:hypothetical protein